MHPRCAEVKVDIGLKLYAKPLCILRVCEILTSTSGQKCCLVAVLVQLTKR